MAKKITSKQVKKFSVAFILGSALVAILLLFSNPYNSPIPRIALWINNLENLFYDSFFKWESLTSEDEETAEGEGVTLSKQSDESIYIVDIDEPSLAKLGQYNSWSRDIHANVVNTLSDGGAAAILFDILFKTADFGKGQTDKTIKALQSVAPDVSWDSISPLLKNRFNDDSLFVTAVQNSGRTTVSGLFETSAAYQHKTQWEPFSTPEWLEAIGTETSIPLENADIPENIEEKEILDDIFPELSHAAATMGFANAFPDPDGIIRNMSLVYRFPSKELYPDASQQIYMALTLAGAFQVFGQNPDNAIIKLGQYLDMGKPFGVYKDSVGTLHTSFKSVTYPMLVALHKALKDNEKIEKDKNQQPFLQVSSKVIATKRDDYVELEILDAQILSERLSNAIRKVTSENLKNLEGELEIDEGITLKKSEETAGNFILEDSEEEEEAEFSPYTISVLEYFKDSLDRIDTNRPVHLSADLDVSFDVNKQVWLSNFIIFSDDVLRDFRSADIGKIEKLKPGEEIRYGKNVRIPINEYGQMKIKYGSRYNTAKAKRSFRHISYYDVSKRRLDPGLYEGKVFVLGSAAPALFDFVSAPHEENYPGVLVQATVLQNILRGNFMVFLESKWQILITIAFALFFMLFALYAGTIWLLPAIVIAFGGYLIVGNEFFIDGLYLGYAKPFLIAILTTISSLLVKISFESRDKKFLNDAFKQYISPELIQEMIDKEMKPTLGGTKSEISAYFTDIASFSTFSEKIGDPTKLVELLNEYLSAMTDTLTQHRGTLDKYEGDAIIAFFGAPMPLENHAQSACETAVSMQEKLLELRKKWISEGDKWPTNVHEMHMRIGINSGDIVTGNMGSEMRKNYTMMGDNVNLAARLESAAKQYGAYIQISENTRKDLIPGSILYRSLDNIRVVGKSEPVKTFEVLGSPKAANAEQLKKLIEIWERAREAYLAMDWDKAIALFTECLDYEPHHPERDPGSKTTPSHVYIKRCSEYKVNPPVAAGETWDGVFTATSK